jgi:hypothetical protein
VAFDLQSFVPYVHVQKLFADQVRQLDGDYVQPLSLAPENENTVLNLLTENGEQFASQNSRMQLREFDSSWFATRLF